MIKKYTHTYVGKVIACKQSGVKNISLFAMMQRILTIAVLLLQASFTYAQLSDSAEQAYKDSVELERIFAEIDSSIKAEKTYAMRLDSINANFTVDKVTLNAEEYKLALMINEYRKARKLPPVKISRSLSYVAQLHANDLYLYDKKIKKSCNIHSWSDKGKWMPVDYYPDHRNQEGMWNKPKELTKYTGKGYEIAFGSDKKDYILSAHEAMAGWKKSINHNAVIINKNMWQDIKWTCIGIGVHKNYACIWFGQEEDPEGYLDIK